EEAALLGRDRDAAGRRRGRRAAFGRGQGTGGEAGRGPPRHQPDRHPSDHHPSGRHLGRPGSVAGEGRRAGRREPVREGDRRVRGPGQEERPEARRHPVLRLVQRPAVEDAERRLRRHAGAEPRVRRVDRGRRPDVRRADRPPLPAGHDRLLRGRQRRAEGPHAGTDLGRLPEVRRPRPFGAAGDADPVRVGEAEPEAARAAAGPAEGERDDVGLDRRVERRAARVHRRLHADARRRRPPADRTVRPGPAAHEPRRVQALEQHHRVETDQGDRRGRQGGRGRGRGDGLPRRGGACGHHAEEGRGEQGRGEQGRHERGTGADGGQL
ncbi:MAG: hypothetical protein AVDCRST_MAG64-3742, partial [uncultured Phycisphaerae bacterium]